MTLSDCDTQSIISCRPTVCHDDARDQTTTTPTCLPSPLLCGARRTSWCYRACSKGAVSSLYQEKTFRFRFRFISHQICPIVWGWSYNPMWLFLRPRRNMEPWSAWCRVWKRLVEGSTTLTRSQLHHKNNQHHGALGSRIIICSCPWFLVGIYRVSR
jgi:hypothetical protein